MLVCVSLPLSPQFLLLVLSLLSVFSGAQALAVLGPLSLPWLLGKYSRCLRRGSLPSGRLSLSSRLSLSPHRVHVVLVTIRL